MKKIIFLLVVILIFSLSFFNFRKGEDIMNGNKLDSLEIIPHRIGHIYLDLNKKDSIPFILAINLSDSSKYIGLMVPDKFLKPIFEESNSGSVTVYVLFDPKKTYIPPMIIGIKKKLLKI